MVVKIGKHTIKFFWDDNNERNLSEDSVETIAGSINRGCSKGRVTQDGRVCTWEDTTGDDILLFGMTQGWFD